MGSIIWMASTWNKLRQLRHRDLLQGVLLRTFERDQVECRVLQSKAFQPLLTRWTDLLLTEGKPGSAVEPQNVPQQVKDAASRSKDVKVKWMIKRLESGDWMHRGTPHFPSVLLEKGPQYPFQPYELLYLRNRVGSIRGTEMVQRIELPKTEAPEPQHQPDLWADGILDDNDLIDYRKAPAGSG